MAARRAFRCSDWRIVDR